MHRYLRLPKTSAPFFSFTLPTNCPSSLKKLPSSNLHGCCGCFVRRVTRFPSEARLLVLCWTPSKFAVNPPKTAPALCPERTRACRTCWSSLDTWTGVRTSHGANDLCRKKAHVERFQDFKISHSRVIEVFFITKGIFRDSEAQLKVNSHFQGKENLWWEYDKKKGVLGHSDTPLSRLSIHQSLLQRNISPSRNFGVNCRTKGPRVSQFSWGKNYILHTGL